MCYGATSMFGHIQNMRNYMPEIEKCVTDRKSWAFWLVWWQLFVHNVAAQGNENGTST